MDIQKKELSTDDGRMTYFVSGQEHGTPVILMHGWGCSSATLRSIASVLEPYCKIYNIDFPGFGESPEPICTWGVESFARLVGQLISYEHITRPILLGHSFGGRVGIWLAAHRSDIKRLILVDSAGIKPRRSISYYIKVYGFKISKKILRLFYGPAKSYEIIEKRRAATASSDYIAASPRMRSILSRVVNEDLRALLPKISVPTLLIWGQNDTATPLRDAHIMEKAVPDAGLVVFEGCGHYSFLDDPIRFAAVIRSFIK